MNTQQFQLQQITYVGTTWEQVYLTEEAWEEWIRGRLLKKWNAWSYVVVSVKMPREKVEGI